MVICHTYTQSDFWARLPSYSLIAHFQSCETPKLIIETFISAQWGFSGISTFAHLKHVKCLTTPSELFDIAILGAPFDTAVSYRPGKFMNRSRIRHSIYPYIIMPRRLSVTP